MALNQILDLSLRRYGAARGSHRHDHFQVLWALDGALELEIDGRGTRMPAGTGRLIYPGERHDFQSPGGSQCLVLDTSAVEWSSRVRTPSFTQAADHLARSLAAALDSGAPFSVHQGALLLSQMWGEPSDASRGARRIDWVELTRWILMRLSAPLTAADLAAQAHLSESHFRARCLARNGCSPMQWVRQMRLERADLLRSSGMSALESARKTGYESAAALSAARRRHGHAMPAKRNH